MKPRAAQRFVIVAFLLAAGRAFAQQPGPAAGQPVLVSDPGTPSRGAIEDAVGSGRGNSPADALAPQAGTGNPQPSASPDRSHKLGPVTLFGNWRFRAEGWDWFKPAAGENAYALEHSLFFLGIRQDSDRFQWLVEGAQDAIVGLPSTAIAPGVQGQLGPGGTYFAANKNSRNNVGGFLKQAYFGMKFPALTRIRLGRFGFSDGAEVELKDQTLAEVVRTRVAQRLIGEFTFSAVERSFDGLQFAFDAGHNNFTFLAARPTEGVYQVDGMGEINVNLFYGAYTLPLSYVHGAGELRVFALGYVDRRGGILKTDNRPLASRTADTGQIQIGTYGANYVHVLHTNRAGQFDLMFWGAFQNGSWGTQTQRAGAFFGELGWQPPILAAIKPWLSAGYSFGSGDTNPNDGVHGTFFQVLPTPRLYARFPFYNMENNEDFYGTGVFRLPHSLVIRAEGHALRLASAQDLWYLGGGAYQSGTFGYVGRATGGSRSLANVGDVSLDFPLRYGFSATLYYGHAWGKAALANIYPAGVNAQLGYVETNFRF